MYMTDYFALELQDISKTFPGTKALDSVSLQIKKGEVHGLMGENGAGKSTLVNIISGVYEPDIGGKILMEGIPVNDNNPQVAQKLGIGFVHQEISLCPHMTVAENIFIGRLPKNKYGFVNYSQLNENGQQVVNRFHNDEIKPTNCISDLTIAQQQIVEIARALTNDLKLLILDEPTSSLSEKETFELFNIIRTLKEEGISVIYISHRIAEIFQICDRLTVLKDGQYVQTVNIEDTNPDKVVSMMVGRSIGNYYPAKAKEVKSHELLRVEGLTGINYFDVDFTLNEGEILGFGGLIGSGRSELMRGLCAIDSTKDGNVFINGEKVIFKDYKDALKAGIVYMTEDRKMDGLFLGMNVEHNISASIIDRLKAYIFIDAKKEEKLCDKYMKDLAIKAYSNKQLCSSLSGGNQQKVLLAKSLAVNPKILIIDEPTRGIDVNVKSEIYKLLRELCNNGIGIIVISSELPEAIGLCDRLVVMRDGNVSTVLSGQDLTEEKIMKYAAKVD